MFIMECYMALVPSKSSRVVSGWARAISRREVQVFPSESTIKIGLFLLQAQLKKIKFEIIYIYTCEVDKKKHVNFMRDLEM